MSEERDKRDAGSATGTDSVDADSAASTVSESDGSVDVDGTTVGQDGTVAAARPTGKRLGRRRAASAESDTDSASAGTSRPANRDLSKTAPAATKKVSAKKSAAKPGPENPIIRIRQFLREVIAELRKVIWPGRKQLITYTSVVLVFVVFMVALISGLDLAFAKGVLWLFG